MDKRINKFCQIMGYGEQKLCVCVYVFFFLQISPN